MADESCLRRLQTARESAKARRDQIIKLVARLKGSSYKLPELRTTCEEAQTLLAAIDEDIQDLQILQTAIEAELSDLQAARLATLEVIKQECP